MDHLDAIDDLRDGIRLRGYAQKDPLVEYKQEAYNMFESLLNRINNQIARKLFRVQPVMPTPPLFSVLSLTNRVPKEKNRPQRPLLVRQRQKWKDCHYPDPG